MKMYVIKDIRGKFVSQNKLYVDDIQCAKLYSSLKKAENDTLEFVEEIIPVKATIEEIKEK